MSDKSLKELKDTVGASKKVVEEMKIEAGKIAEFARALHMDDPECYDKDAATEAGLATIPVPLTFLRTSVFSRYRPSDLDRDPVFDLGFDEGREIHGEHRFEFERPVHVGDTLSGVATLDDVYQRETDSGTLTFAVQRIEYYDTDDDLVATEWMTVIELPPSDVRNRGDGNDDT